MRKLLTVIITAALLLCGTATPARAAGTTIYFYDLSNGTVLVESVSASIRPKSACFTLAPLARNKTSYIVNNSPHYWIVYDNATCSSFPGTIYPNSQGAMNSDYNNKIESYYRAT